MIEIISNDENQGLKQLQLTTKFFIQTEISTKSITTVNDEKIRTGTFSSTRNQNNSITYWIT